MGLAQKRASRPYGETVERFASEERRLRILVVDDEPAVRRTVRRVLGKECFAFLEAADVEEARASLVCRTPPDLLILDLALKSGFPEEGIEFLREVSAQPTFLPTVVLSGRADVKLAVEAMHLGAVDVIEKGVDADEIREAVRRGLERAIARRSMSDLDSVSRVRVPSTTELDADDSSTDLEPPIEDELRAMFPQRRRPMRPLEHYVEEVKRQVVAEAITRAGGNLTDAARVLKMKRTNFHRLAVRLGLHEPKSSGTLRAALPVPPDDAEPSLENESDDEEDEG